MAANSNRSEQAPIMAPPDWQDRVRALLAHHDVHGPDKTAPVTDALLAMFGSWEPGADRMEEFGRAPHPTRFGPTAREVTAQARAEADEYVEHVPFTGTPGVGEVWALVDAAWSMVVEQQGGRGSWSMAKSWAFDDLRRAMEPFVGPSGDAPDTEKVLAAARSGLDPATLTKAADLVWVQRFARENGEVSGPDSFYAGVVRSRVALLAAAKEAGAAPVTVEVAPTGQEQDAAALAAEVQRLHSWAGLMDLLDEHWPEDIFPTQEDRASRDPGPRIVSLLRWLDAARGDAVAGLEQTAWAITAELVCCGEDAPCGEEICRWGAAARAIVLTHAAAVKGLAPGQVQAGPWPRWAGERSAVDSPAPGEEGTHAGRGTQEPVYGIDKGGAVKIARSLEAARAYAADVTKGGVVVVFDPAAEAWVPVHPQD